MDGQVGSLYYYSLYYLDYDWKWGLSQSEVLRLV